MKFFKNTKYIRRCERLEVRMRQCWGIGGALAGDQMVWRLSLHCSSSLFNTCSSSFPLGYIYIYIGATFSLNFCVVFHLFVSFLDVSRTQKAMKNIFTLISEVKTQNEW